MSELLHEYDRLVHEFTLDPTMAAEQSHPLAVELTELFDAESDVPATLLNAWATSYGRPPEDNQPALVSYLNDVESISEDEVGFTACTHQRLYAYDEHADLVVGIGYEDRISEGTALRVDGSWVLHELGVVEATHPCEEAWAE